MSSHRRLSRRTMRFWLGLNGLILVGFAAWILEPSATAPDPDQPVVPAAPPARPPVLGTIEERPALTKADVLDGRGLRFGISAPEVPWSSAHVDGLTAAAGAPPTMIQFFVTWRQDYPSETVELSYQRGALPVLSWEPWAGSELGTSQPEYALAKIVAGDFDEYIRSFAVAVRDHGWPVAIRFAHEMNGDWYPWSERKSGNRPGEFVLAWRHVHDIFQQVGATDVIWLWSPNILRPVPEVSLEALYPGEAYVDWVGMVGYAVEESTAAAVFDPTLGTLRQFTDKPVVITETGVQPGERKVPWIEDFFTWLAEHPDVVGFIWFEYDPAQGSSADWRFTATLETIEAFRDGLARSRLAAAPLAPVSTAR